MADRILVEHSPSSLTAYRKAIGISVSLLAQKTQITERTLAEAETHSKTLTLKQLQKLADALVVSAVQLVTDNVCTADIPPVVDHRNQLDITDEAQKAEQTYQLNKLIHQVYQDRDNLLDLYELTDEDSASFSLCLTGGDALEDAYRIREFLQVEHARITVQGSDDYYRAWRTLLAKKDILVIEKPRLKIGSEGLALFYENLPTIVILTSGQSPSRRLFTMMHELVHLGLRQSCVDGDILNDKKAIESYCNAVAGHVLVPENVVSQIYDDKLEMAENIANIRKKTHTSKQSIAIQLNILGFISRQELSSYFSCLDNVSRQEQHFGVKKKHMIYNQYGQLYLQQLVGAVWDGALNITAAMNMVGLTDANDFHYLKDKVFE